MSDQSMLVLSQIAIALGGTLVALGGYGAFHYSRAIETRNEAAAEARQAKDEADRKRRDSLSASSARLESPDSTDGTPFLTFGPDSGYASFYPMDAAGTTALEQVEKNLKLRVRRISGRIAVSVTLRDRDGKFIARMEDNEWQVKRDAIWDRNYSANALEVIDDHGDVVLQVELSGDKAKVQGIFFTGKGRGFGLGTGYDQKTGRLMSAIQVIGRTTPRERWMKFRPLFRYPSEQHLGERVNN